jgi:hypothetical protein
MISFKLRHKPVASRAVLAVCATESLRRIWLLSVSRRRQTLAASCASARVHCRALFPRRPLAADKPPSMVLDVSLDDDDSWILFVAGFYS